MTHLKSHYLICYSELETDKHSQLYCSNYFNYTAVTTTVYHHANTWLIAGKLIAHESNVPDILLSLSIQGM